MYQREFAVGAIPMNAQASVQVQVFKSGERCARPIAAL